MSVSTQEPTPVKPVDRDDVELIFARLAAPFRHVKSRPGKGGQEYQYIDAAMVMNRLDDAVGPGNWKEKYRVVDTCVYCSLSITLPDGQRVTRGGASGFDLLKEGEKQSRLNSLVKKTAFSEAFKLAALKFGVGRYIKNKGRMPAYYQRVSGQIRQASDPAAAESVPPVRRPEPSAPPTAAEFPSRRPRSPSRVGAILYRTITSPPFGDNDDKQLLYLANEYASEHGYPARLVDWNLQQVQSYWHANIEESMPEPLAAFYAHINPRAADSDKKDQDVK
jgi:hypothetical protein